MTAVLILRRFWPVFAALAVLGALWAWGNSRYDAGYDEAMREATEAAALASAEWQREVDTAEANDTQSRAVTAGKFKPLKERAANAPASLDCPDTATRQLLDEAIRASHAASAARPRS